MKAAWTMLPAFLMTATAFAMPNVGDDAVFDATITSGTQSYQGTAEFSLTSYDASTDQFNQHTVQTIGGSTQANDALVDHLAFITDAQATDAVASCAHYGGTAATVTVPAGTFATCAIPVQNPGQTGTSWIAPVAFGVVKQDVTNSDGSHVVLSLRTSTMGAPTPMPAPAPAPTQVHVRFAPRVLSAIQN